MDLKGSSNHGKLWSALKSAPHDPKNPLTILHRTGSQPHPTGPDRIPSLDMHAWIYQQYSAPPVASLETMYSYVASSRHSSLEEFGFLQQGTPDPEPIVAVADHLTPYSWGVPLDACCQQDMLRPQRLTNGASRGRSMDNGTFETIRDVTVTTSEPLFKLKQGFLSLSIIQDQMLEKCSKRKHSLHDQVVLARTYQSSAGKLHRLHV